MWNLMPDGPILAHSFDVGAGAILALVVQQGTTTAYAGCQDGQVKVIDLEMKAIIRTIIAQEGVDILSLSLLGSDLYTCSANGDVQVRSITSFVLSLNDYSHCRGGQRRSTV